MRLLRGPAIETAHGGVVRRRRRLADLLRRYGGAVAAACVGACDAPPRSPPDDPRVAFRAAVVGAPVGSFLGVWGDPSARRAWIAGGYVGLDPARAPRNAAGRLLEYVAPGRFVTRCTTDATLWWVSGAPGAGEVWAVGDRGRVVRRRAGGCEVIPLGLAFEGGEPTLWGVVVRAPNDVWVVGGSPRPDGPRGVLLRGDGTRWRQEALPARAQRENLYKIAIDGDAVVAVGSGGLILRRDGTDGVWREVPSSATPTARIFTVSCESGVCFGVGSSTSGFVLRGEATRWETLGAVGDASLTELPALNGVWARAHDDVYAVGVDGFVAHFGGDGLRLPRALATSASLHGVGGFGEVVIAAGGELANATPTQRGVILLRDEDASEVTLDGARHTGGALQGARPGAGQ